jgi:hypothetical protein
MQGYSQGIANNGQLDDISEFTSKFTVPLVMPDGTKLFTDFLCAENPRFFGNKYLGL